MSECKNVMMGLAMFALKSLKLIKPAGGALAKPSHAPPLAKPIHAPPLAKPIHLQNSVSVRYLSRIVMDKKTFFAVLLIMKRIRRKWEENVYKTWSYNLCYSTRWMGPCRNVISLDSPNVEEEEANQILFNGMRNMIQYKHAHRAQASSTDSCSAGSQLSSWESWSRSTPQRAQAWHARDGSERAQVRSSDGERAHEHARDGGMLTQLVYISEPMMSEP